MLQVGLAIQITIFFYLSLIGLTAIIIAVSTYFYLKNKAFHLDFTHNLADIARNIRELPRYSIDNLSDVVDLMDNNNYTLLSGAAYKLKTDSNRLYHNQWISDPSELLTAKRILNKSDFNSYSYEICIYVLITGVLSSLMTLILSLGISHDRNILTAISSIPMIISIVCSSIIALNTKRRLSDLNTNLTNLSESIKERVPVFQELAGTAALIESFFRYDRSMSNSVNDLGTIIKDLANNKIAESIANNIKIALETELLPVILDSANSLKESAVNLEKERENGLSKLADQYSSAITSSIEKHLLPFYQELDNITNNIYEANKSTELSLQSIENYRDESLNLHSRLTKSIETMNQANEIWSNNLITISKSTSTLSEVSEKFSQQQMSMEENLSNNIHSLQNNLDKFENTFKTLNETISNNNNQVLEQIKFSRSDYENLVEKIKELGILFADQSEALNKQSLDIAHEVKNLNNGLSATMQNFSAGINSTVINILDEFDSNLAEISDRLSNTTADIDDTINSWIDETRYQENRKNKLVQNNKTTQQNMDKQDILDFLTTQSISSNEKRIRNSNQDSDREVIEYDEF